MPVIKTLGEKRRECLACGKMIDFVLVDNQEAQTMKFVPAESGSFDGWNFIQHECTFVSYEELRRQEKCHISTQRKE